MGKFTFFIATCAALFTFIQTATAVDNGNLKKLDDLDQLYVSSKPFELSNPDAFFNYRRDILKNGFYELQRWDECIDTYKRPIKWPKNKDEDVGEAFEYKMFLLECVQAFLAGGDYSDAKAIDFEKLLIHWVNGEDKALKLASFNKSENQWYTVGSFVGNLAQWFAFYSDRLTMPKGQKQKVEEYITNYLLQFSFADGLTKNLKACPTTPSSILDKSVDTDWCGSVRFKVATGKLTLGFKLENEKLISQGIEDLNILLQAYDEDVYFVPYAPAKKGGYGFSYYMRQGIFLSVLTEIIAMRGYDFLAFQLPNGGLVSDALDFTYRVAVDDFKLLGKYPGKNEFKRNKDWQWDRLLRLSHSQFATDIAVTNGRYDPSNTKEQFATRNPRFASLYRREDFALSLSYIDNLVDDFSSISAMALFLGNSPLNRKQWSEKVASEITDTALKETTLAKLDVLEPMGINLSDNYQFDNKLSDYDDVLPADSVSFSEITGWTVSDAKSIEITNLEFIEKKAGSSKQKYKVRYKVEAYLPKQRTVQNRRVTIFVNGEQVQAGIYAEFLVQKGFVGEDVMKKLKTMCDYDNVDEYYSIILPIVSKNPISNNRVPCYFDNSHSNELTEILKFVLIAGREIAQLEGIIKD